MALQHIKSYSFKNIFTVHSILFEEACVVNEPQQTETFTIFWIKKGEGTYHIDFKEYSFKDNVLFFLSPGQVFNVDSEKIKEAYQLSFKRDFYCIQTHDTEISCNGVLFNNIYETPFVKPCEEEIKKLDQILENLIDEFNQNETAQYDMLQSYLKQFIIQSVRIKKESPVLKEDLETKLFKDFSVLVNQNFNKLHSVTEYANRLGLSPKSLTKHFQKIGVIAPREYIKNRIILESKRQLLYSTKAIKNIAFDLGFNDAAYFSRFFTKATGLSPLKFKKDQKN